jgi:pyrroloquinoline quinone (PQQ) biosynthesis protein C
MRLPCNTGPMSRPALPVDEFLNELRDLVRNHPFDPTLAQSLKYGKAELAHVRRWAKDYLVFIHEDAQATAAMLARCLDRRLILLLSQGLARKTGFYKIRSAVELYLNCTAALGIPREELERHYACAETLGAMFTRRNFQHASFLEGFAASQLVSEGALMDVVADHSSFLAQKGFAEYLRRHYSLPEGSTDYWRAYEDFRSLDGDRAWEIAADLAGDASSQETIRRTFDHTLAVTHSMRRAWSDLVAGRYWDAEVSGPSTRTA